MSKNGIAHEEFMKVAAEYGIAPVVQSGFVRLNGPKGRAYVARTKTVYRVDISDCTPPEHDAIKPMTAEDAKLLRLGKVRGQLDFTKEPAQVLEAFRTLLGFITGQEPVEAPEPEEEPMTETNRLDAIRASQARLAAAADQ